MSLKSILNDSNSTVRRQMDETKGLVGKWSKTGLLEGIDSEYERHGMAIMLENQAKQLVTEANSTGTASNSEQWSGVALPLVRRVFAEIAAKDFVSVQPMNLPSGLVFYMDFKYGTAQPGFNNTATPAGNPSAPSFQTNSVFGVTSGLDQDPTGGLYGQGRFGYSINDVTTTLAASGSALSTTLSGSISAALTMASDADFDEFNYDSKFTLANSASIAAGHFKKISVPAALLSEADLEGVRAYLISGSTAAKITAYYPQFTKNVNDTTLTFIVSGSITNTGLNETIAIGYSKQPAANSRGDFQDTSGDSITNINIPEINVELKSESIVAKTRKLKAIWSPEFAQDLNAYHSIDAEAELTSMLSEYISQEIDLEILDMLIQNAVTNERWSAQIGFDYIPSTDTFSQAGFTGTAYTQGTWFQTLGTKIQKVSNKIHQKTMRGGANFLVCSPDVATILESIPGYAADTDGTKMQFAMGVQKVGLLNSRFTVYKNPYMTDNVILLGYRGAQFLETGAVYAPYIPLIMTPLVYDPTNFTPRKGVMTRYAKKMVRPEFYGTIKVHGLHLI
jgi:hypothetical protein